MYRHLATKPGVQPVPGGAVAVPHRVVSVTVVTCGPGADHPFAGGTRGGAARYEPARERISAGRFDLR